MSETSRDASEERLPGNSYTGRASKKEDVPEEPIKNKKVIEAMRETPRHEFMPIGERTDRHHDEVLAGAEHRLPVGPHGPDRGCLDHEINVCADERLERVVRNPFRTLRELVGTFGHEIVEGRDHEALGVSREQVADVAAAEEPDPHHGSVWS